MFWLGIMLQLLLAARFHLFPIGGRLDTMINSPISITRFFLVDGLITGNWAVFKMRFPISFFRHLSCLSRPGKHHPDQPGRDAGGSP
jgi:ABC-type dipeptide/oligopeptide/nickel transport system permease component